MREELSPSGGLRVGPREWDGGEDLEMGTFKTVLHCQGKGAWSVCGQRRLEFRRNKCTPLACL